MTAKSIEPGAPRAGAPAATAKSLEVGRTGFEMGCTDLKNVEVTITDETTQAELLVHLMSPGNHLQDGGFLLDGWCRHGQCVEGGHHRQAAQAQVLPAGPHVLLFREGSVLSMKGS